MKKRQLVSADEAVRVSRQPTTICSDCPFAREALPGWLGTLTAQDWIKAAHGESTAECHTRLGSQCVGMATYRGNICKLPRDPKTLRMKADRVTVFSNPMEFIAHHEG